MQINTKMLTFKETLHKFTTPFETNGIKGELSYKNLHILILSINFMETVV